MVIHNKIPVHVFLEGHSYVTPCSLGGGVSFPGKKCYEGVRFNVISVTRGWVGVKRNT